MRGAVVFQRLGLTAIVVTLLATAAGTVRSYPEAATGAPLFNDFRVFRAAGQLVVEGRADLLYDAEALGERAFESEEGRFFNPPPFAVLFVPLAAMAAVPGAVLWLAAGAALLAVVLHRLGAPAWWMWLILVSPPALVTIVLGQASFLTAALVGVGAIGLLEDRPWWTAGAVVGLFFKPYFAVGLLLLLAVSGRRRPAAVAAAGWLGLAAASFLMVPDLLSEWSRSWDALTASTRLFESGPAGMVSPLGSTTATIVWGAAALAGLGGLSWLIRSECVWSVQVAGAAAVGVWLTPHLLVYDWLVLAIPLTVLATRLSEEVGGNAGAALVISSAVARPIDAWQLDTIGRAVSVAGLTIVAVTVWVWRRSSRRTTP